MALNHLVLLLHLQNLFKLLMKDHVILQFIYNLKIVIFPFNFKKLMIKNIVFKFPQILSYSNF